MVIVDWLLGCSVATSATLVLLAVVEVDVVEMDETELDE